MEGNPEDSNTGSVVYTRKEIFEMVKGKFQLSLNALVSIVEEDLRTKTGNSFEMHPDEQNSLKTLLTKMKLKWQAVARNSGPFYKNNEDWLKTTLIITNALPTATQKQVEISYKRSAPSPSPSPEPGTSGRPSSTFEEGSERSKRRKSEALLSIHSTAELAHATQLGLRKSGAVEASNVVKAVTTKSPTRAAKFQAAVKESGTPRPVEMLPEIALSLIIESKLTVTAYLSQRKLAIECHAPIYPSYHRVLVAKKRCYPSGIEVTETSAEVKLQQLLDHTSERILLVQSDVIKALDPETVANLTLIVKWGCDGSSGQSEYKQSFSDEKSSDASIFLVSLVPLRIITTCKKTQTEILVWKNPRPSSPRYCRPIKVQFAHETVQSTLNEKQLIDEQIKCLVPYETVIDGKSITIDYKMFFTMIDGKVCNSVTGTSSAMKCYLCGATLKDFNNLELVCGRKIDSSYLCFGLSSLHAWIRFFECCLHIGYKLGTKQWQSRGKETKEIVAARKKAIQDGFKTKLSLKVDIPKQGYGSSNDGNTARRFFEAADVSAQILGVDVELINRFHVILQVLACGFSVDAAAFDNYCMITAEFFVQKYPWFYMPTTVHKILIHGPQIIEAAELPIGELSEEAQEARNKDFKKYRENFARKVSREKTMQDVFHWLMASSDPLVSSLRKITPKKSKSLSRDAIKLLLSSDGFPCSANDDVSSVSSDGDSSVDEYS